jgi:hypothetical protein
MKVEERRGAERDEGGVRERNGGGTGWREREREERVRGEEGGGDEGG